MGERGSGGRGEGGARAPGGGSACRRASSPRQKSRSPRMAWLWRLLESGPENEAFMHLTRKAGSIGLDFEHSNSGQDSRPWREHAPRGVRNPTMSSGMQGRVDQREADRLEVQPANILTSSASPSSTEIGRKHRDLASPNDRTGRTICVRLATNGDCRGPLDTGPPPDTLCAARTPKPRSSCSARECLPNRLPGSPSHRNSCETHGSRDPLQRAGIGGIEHR
jgi:hypothetical protein